MAQARHVGHTLGALTLSWSESEREYGPADFRLEGGGGLLDGVQPEHEGRRERAQHLGEILGCHAAALGIQQDDVGSCRQAGDKLKRAGQIPQRAD